MNSVRPTLNWELDSLADFFSSPLYIAYCRDKIVSDPKPNRYAGRNFHLEHWGCGFQVKERSGFLSSRTKELQNFWARVLSLNIVSLGVVWKVRSTSDPIKRELLFLSQLRKWINKKVEWLFSDLTDVTRQTREWDSEGSLFLRC